MQYYSRKMRPARFESGGIRFDSKGEAQAYYLLLSRFHKITCHRQEQRLGWKIDFTIDLEEAKEAEYMRRLVEVGGFKEAGNSATHVQANQRWFVEFKGVLNPQFLAKYRALEKKEKKRLLILCPGSTQVSLTNLSDRLEIHPVIGIKDAKKILE